MRRLLGSANLFYSLGKFDDRRVHNHKTEGARRHRVGLWTARRVGSSGACLEFRTAKAKTGGL